MVRIDVVYNFSLNLAVICCRINGEVHFNRENMNYMVRGDLVKYGTFLLLLSLDIPFYVQFLVFITPKHSKLPDCVATPSPCAYHKSGATVNIHFSKMQYILDHPFHQYQFGKNQ